MPSAVAAGRPGGLRIPGAGGLRIVAIAAASVAALLSIVIAAVLVVGMSDWGSDSLRREAERVIEGAVGFDVSSTIGPTRLTFDGSRFLALELADVDLVNARTAAPILKAGAMRFGIRLFPLLTGRLLLGSASLSNARVDFGAIPLAGNTDWTARLRNERGLIDPDKIVPLLFAQIDAIMGMVGNGSTQGLDLEDVVFVIPVNGQTREVTVQSGTISESSPGVLSVEVAADVAGRAVSIEGTATRDAASGRIGSLDIQVKGEALAATATGAPVKSMNQLGGFSIGITGHDLIGAEPARLALQASLEQSVLDFGARGLLKGDVDFGLTLQAGSGKVEIDRLKVEVGRNSLEFNGAFGPQPASESGTDAPAYRYELLSTRTIAAPEESPEKPLPFSMRVSGVYDPATRIMRADEINMASDSGAARGTARVELVEGKAPGFAMALDVRRMQVAHFKQLWPFFAGPKARLWVFNHVFGGTVRSSRIELKVQPGRIGDGVPLSTEEISARFEIDGTRFDTAGLIPPVRDASGVVEVHGNDVDVSIVTGTSYLPSGRQVQASNATMAVRAFNKQPVIGRLEMDVTGSADAVAELATYDPINVLGRVGLKPEELSGTVSGHVSADVPLQKGIDPKTLNWLVALKFDAFAVDHPFEGQVLTEATGSITIDPSKALLTANGKLNGVPAELSLVEPLRDGAAERERNVSLVLNDQARDLLAPGLAGILRGPVKVSLQSEAGSRAIVADLKAARIDLPWVGWSKGAGVAATAKFTASGGADNITLSDFSLSGETFSAKGSFTIANGKLSNAKLDSLKLNRGDDVAVAIKRTAKGYGVDVSGKSLDARALIKRVTGNEAGKSGATGKGGGQSEDAAVALRLKVASLGGFNDEALGGVVLSYDGVGSVMQGLSLSATTSSGSPISIGSGKDGAKGLQLSSEDAGSVLRFLDIYEHMQGGSIKVALTGPTSGDMNGQIDARDFWIINEPKLASIVRTTPAGSNRSLTQAVRKDIDTSRVKFERGYAQIRKGPGLLEITNGVLRGPLIGTTFQGTLFNPAGKMDMTGTFMPAYGLNRIFGELPLVGAILGNGRDRGLIGVTYRLRGDAKSPRLDINPLSVMAPGIFRSIFEFQ